MPPDSSDALVFFGATGDLAHKKIFPALQAMVKHGFLNAPIIGVAKAGWTLDQLRGRARARRSEKGWGARTTFVSDWDPTWRSPSPYGRRCRGRAMVGQEVELLATQGGRDEMGAYARLLGDAMKGDATLFARQDTVEAEWRIVAPILASTSPPHEYEVGTWGPVEADRLFAGSGCWHKPESPPPTRSS